MSALHKDRGDARAVRSPRFDHEAARNLRGEGHTYAEIGRRLGVSWTAARSACDPAYLTRQRSAPRMATLTPRERTAELERQLLVARSQISRLRTQRDTWKLRYKWAAQAARRLRAVA